MIEIRAGLHTGECELLPGDDIGGIAVHIGARIAGLAPAGDVLEDRGVHELKGIPEPWRLLAVDS